MLKYGNKEFRNLQEQVEQNMKDIDYVLNEGQALATYGLKVVEEFDTEEDFEAWEESEQHTHQYGDAVIIGTAEPYDMKVWTRANLNVSEDHWFDLGAFPLAGPQGEKGEQGETGPQGEQGPARKLVGRTMDPTDSYGIDFPAGSLCLNRISGDLFYRTTNATTNLWSLWLNIKGPAGVNGAPGEDGAQGPQGPQGPKGDTGDAGGFINIRGELASSSLLPSPASLNDPTAAYLVGDNKDLYIQEGETKETRVWVNVGMLNMGTYVTVDGNFQNTWDADTKQDASNAVTTDTTQTITGDKKFYNSTIEVTNKATIWDNGSETDIRDGSITCSSGYSSTSGKADALLDSTKLQLSYYSVFDTVDSTQYFKDKIQMNHRDADSVWTTSYLNLPDKPAGTYTIATTDDIQGGGNPDEKTIITNDDGKLETVVGGGIADVEDTVSVSSWASTSNATWRGYFSGLINRAKWVVGTAVDLSWTFDGVAYTATKEVTEIADSEIKIEVGEGGVVRFRLPTASYGYGYATKITSSTTSTLSDVVIKFKYEGTAQINPDYWCYREKYLDVKGPIRVINPTTGAAYNSDSTYLGLSAPTDRVLRVGEVSSSASTTSGYCFYLDASSGTLYPSSKNMTLGASAASRHWNTLYCDNLSDGTTTKTMTEVLAGVTPSNMVTTDTAQIITGSKTLTKALFVENTTSNKYASFGTSGIQIYETNGASVTKSALFNVDGKITKIVDNVTYEITTPNESGELALLDYVPDLGDIDAISNGTNNNEIRLDGGDNANDILIDTSNGGNNVDVRTTGTFNYNGNEVATKADIPYVLKYTFDTTTVSLGSAIGGIVSGTIVAEWDREGSTDYDIYNVTFRNVRLSLQAAVSANATLFTFGSDLPLTGHVYQASPAAYTDSNLINGTHVILNNKTAQKSFAAASAISQTSGYIYLNGLNFMMRGPKRA